MCRHKLTTLKIKNELKVVADIKPDIKEVVPIIRNNISRYSNREIEYNGNSRESTRRDNAVNERLGKSSISWDAFKAKYF